MGVIYKITNPSGRLYVGKTYDLSARIASHKCCAKKTTKAIILYNSIRKYGWDAHVLEVIEEIPDGQLNDREMFWISELKTYNQEHSNGMNMTRGGDGQRSTWMHDVERRKKQSERFSGSGGAFYGRHHTEENKKIIGQKAKKWNLNNGWNVPRWGVEKSRLKKIRAVIAYDKTGTLISGYVSLTEAAKTLGIDVQGVKDSLKFGQWHKGQYLFKYKTDDDPPIIEVGKIEVKAEKRPVLFLNDEFEIMACYASAIEASEDLQVPVTSIRRASLYNYLWPIRTGHVFIYKDIYESLNLDN